MVQPSIRVRKYGEWLREPSGWDFLLSCYVNKWWTSYLKQQKTKNQIHYILMHIWKLKFSFPPWLWTTIWQFFMFCRAFFHIVRTELFWLCLVSIIVAALLPRFVIKILYQYFTPCDVQIAKEAEKFGFLSGHGAAEIEMNPIEPSQRWLGVLLLMLFFSWFTNFFIYTYLLLLCKISHSLGCFI